MSDHCTLPPPGWACTRARGHSGPCATVRLPDRVQWAEEGVPVRRRVWLLAAFAFSLAMWALIVWGILAWVGKPEVKRDVRTACERSNPPWAIAERCRR